MRKLYKLFLEQTATAIMKKETLCQMFNLDDNSGNFKKPLQEPIDVVIQKN